MSVVDKNLDEIKKSIQLSAIFFARLYCLRESTDMPVAVRTWFEAQHVLYKPAVGILERHYSAGETRKVSLESLIDPKPAGVRLPEKGRRNVLITSALPYVNNVPHLGNIIGCVLSADVYARYSRLRGDNVLYVCGTDEYGTATETKAIEEGVSCQELCDKYHAIHSQVYKWFDIDFDYFGRTTTPKHTEISQSIFHAVNDKNLFSTETIQQLFCEKCSRFLADRFVEGICPKCQYPDARGDQCDGCGKLLNATELVNPRCKLDGTTPVIKSSEHMFFKLPDLQERCEEWVAQSSVKGKWSANGISITNSWMKEGLKPRCITRDMKWGTPVPLETMKGKVLYVWFDAPIGYLSITANYTDEWEKWWKSPSDVELFQFMGKDNVPFHTVIFPCTLLGTEQPYTMLHHLSTTEYLNYEGDKFSKSRGIGVFGNNAIDSGIPVSVWRYYLLTIRPEVDDSMFAWSDMGTRTNTELLTNLGNFINRVQKFLKAKYNSVVPALELNDADKVFIADVNKLLTTFNEEMGAVKIRSGLRAMMEISSRGNSYLQDNRIDNTLFEQEPKRCATVIAVSCNVIYLLSALIYPFMPSTSEAVLKQLNVPQRNIPNEFELDLHTGHRTGTPELLFRRLEEKRLKELFMQYGGDKIKEKREKEAALKAKAALDAKIAVKKAAKLALDTEVK